MDRAATSDCNKIKISQRIKHFDQSFDVEKVIVFYIIEFIMSNEVSTVALLFNECYNKYPDLRTIDEYVNKCRCNNEDMNKLFRCGVSKLSSLHISCHLGHHEIVERLLDSRNHFESSVNVNAFSDGYL